MGIAQKLEHGSFQMPQKMNLHSCKQYTLFDSLLVISRKAQKVVWLRRKPHHSTIMAIADLHFQRGRNIQNVSRHPELVLAYCEWHQWRQRKWWQLTEGSMQTSEDFGFCFLAIVYSTSVPFIIPLPHHYKIILSRKGFYAVHTYQQYLPYSPIRELFTDGMYCTYLLPTPWVVCTCCKNIRCRIYSRYISYIAIWLPKAEVRHSLPLSWEGRYIPHIAHMRSLAAICSLIFPLICSQW